MLAARRTLVTLAALLAAAYAQTKCGSATSGSKGTSIELKEFIMKPGQADFNVDVPNVCPAPSAIVGSTVVACDDDVAPLVVAYEPAHAHLHRQGRLETDGVIKTTVYCGPAPKPRARYGLQPKPYLQYGVQSAYDSVRPRVSRILAPGNLYDGQNVYNPYVAPKPYDPSGYGVPEAHEHASHEQAPRAGYEAPRTYADVGVADAPQPYGPYVPLAPVVVPLIQN